MKEKELLAIVFGNVQGVFYRRFIQMKASELGITGTATNLADGTVEVVAQGKEDALKKLLEFIYAGTEEAEVESATVSWGPIHEETRMPDFAIL
jgi:acylphosphatase